MNTRESYAEARKVGRCVLCPNEAMKHPDGHPMSLCGYHAEANAEFHARRKAERLKAGRCPHCGGEPTPGYKTCLAARQCDRVYHHRPQRVIHPKRFVRLAGSPPLKLNTDAD